MKTTLLLAALLVAGSVLVDVSMVLATQGLYPSLRVFLCFALQLSQVSLMAVWLGLGRRFGPLRFLATFGVCLAWCFMMGVVLSDPEPEEWFLYFLPQVVLVAVPLALLRLAGRGLVHPLDDLNARRRLQFSIGDLLGWITVVAVALGTLQTVLQIHTISSSKDEAWAFIYVGVSVAVVTWAAVWAALGSRLAVLRFATLAVVTIAAYGGLMASITAENRYSAVMAASAVLYAATTLLTFGSLWVFRVAGFRLRGKRQQPE